MPILCSSTENPLNQPPSFVAYLQPWCDCGEMEMSSIAFARLCAGVSQRELAALADVPRSTVSRIERGIVSPSISTVNRLLAALGQRLDESTVAVADLSANAACRMLLDPDVDAAGVDGVDGWVTAWTRAGFINPEGTVESPGRLCQIAGANTKLRSRPGRSVAPVSPVELAQHLDGAGVGYALTGSGAANRMKLVGSESWTVCYVDDVDLAAAAFAAPLSDRFNTLLLPFDEITSQGVWSDDDRVVVADPIQVVIDLYAGVDRMPDQADILVEWFNDQQLVDA
ncbi:hypothetical protein BH24ACT5_BH24ACT5_03050 [soil metagenome]